MACCPPSEDPPADAGFTTAVFAGIVLMLAMVATATALLARQQLQGADREVTRTQQAYDFEGRATSATARLLSFSGAPTLRWVEPSQEGDLTITLEPEGRKVGVDHIAEPGVHDLIVGLVGDSTAADIEAQAALLNPDKDGIVHRTQIEALSSDRRWRECASTLISPYSRLTAFALAAPASDPQVGTDAHAGEVWRVTVAAANGAWLDRIVRMTGVSANPVAIVEDSVVREPGNDRVDCLTDVLRLMGAMHETG